MMRIAPYPLLVALLALACGCSEPDQPRLDAWQQRRIAEAMESLSTAPERVRLEVLKTCDKWKHIDHPCDEQEVRIEQLECWLEDGHPAMEFALRRKTRPRARDLRIMLRQDLCMEMRRWRKLKKGPVF